MSPWFWNRPSSLSYIYTNDTFAKRSDCELYVKQSVEKKRKKLKITFTFWSRPLCMQQIHKLDGIALEAIRVVRSHSLSLFHFISFFPTFLFASFILFFYYCFFFLLSFVLSIYTYIFPLCWPRGLLFTFLLIFLFALCFADDLAYKSSLFRH